MISERFEKTIDGSDPERSIAGVLFWQWPDDGGHALCGDVDLRAIKQPVLDRFASDARFAVNDFEALPSAVILGPASAWKQLLASNEADFRASDIFLDINFEIAMVD